MGTYWDEFIEKYADRLMDVSLRSILQAFFFFSDRTTEGVAFAETIMRGPGVPTNGLEGEKTIKEG